MNSRRCIDQFNSNRFFFLLFIMCFCLLVAFRLDGLNDWSLWTLCIPMWIWTAVVVVGCTLGLTSCATYEAQPCERSVECISMLLSTFYHICLFCFEILLCLQVETDKIKWVYVFVPLYVLCFTGVITSVWAIRNHQPFELELFASVNVLSLIFTALRLDSWIQWTWAVVFIPLWIVMGVLVLLEIYGLLLAVILCRSPDLIPEQRNHTLTTTVGYAFVVFPLLAFEILMVFKLDGDSQLSYFIIFVPMFLVILALMMMTFFIKGGGSTWFGLRKPLCQALLDICLPLQEYGNISYKFANLGRHRYRTRFQSSANALGERNIDSSGLRNQVINAESTNRNLLPGRLVPDQVNTAAFVEVNPESRSPNSSASDAVLASAPIDYLHHAGNGPQNLSTRSNTELLTWSPHTLRVEVPD